MLIPALKQVLIPILDCKSAIKIFVEEEENKRERGESREKRLYISIVSYSVHLKIYIC